MAAYDIYVQGAGAVGLASALALGRQGLRVALLEGRPEDPGREDVRAYALNAASVALLRTLRVWDALPDDARTAVYDMHVEGDARGAALEFSAWGLGAETLAWIVDAAELDAALKAAVRFSPHVSSVTAPVAATLQVFAEGRDSASRERLGVRMPVHRYGQRAVAARLQAEWPHGGLARQWFHSPDVLALLPLDRPQPGHGYGLVWSLPEARAETLLALSPEAFEAELAEATGGAAGRLTLVGRRADWPLTLARADRVCGSGWVLVGDAAHVVHPLAGQGLNLGLADVAALAAAIEQREPWRALSDEKLLRRYARERDGPTRAMAHLTDGLLRLFASEQPVLRELRNRGLTLVNRLPVVKRALGARAFGD